MAKKIFFAIIVILFLIAFRISINFAFWAAHSDQNIKLTKLTVNLGANIEGRDNGRTPLIYSVESNDVKMVQTLLELGADPNNSYPTGVTPLEIAEGEDFKKIAKLLVKYGAKRRMNKE